MKRIIYLDNSATTAVLSEVARAVEEAMLANFGNPSSLHGLGVAAERLLRKAREQVARLLGASPEEIYFTSGGTEANNWAIWGLARAQRRRGRHIITSAIEHPSVLAACRRLEREGFTVTYLPVDSRGSVRLEALEKALSLDTILVSIMSVNNEVGSLQPLEEIAELVSSRSQALLHIDHIQGYGKVPLSLKRLRPAAVSLSAHKIHGPKGVGALYLRRDLRLEPLLVGGDQEGGLRAGTENVPGIVGFGTAASLSESSWMESAERMRKLKVKFVQDLLQNLPQARVNGPEPEAGAPHILNVSFPRVKAEVLVHMLEERGIYVSTGSACHSRRREASHVLKAMGVPSDLIEGAIRISLSRLNTEEEIEEAVRSIKECVEELQKL